MLYIDSIVVDEENPYYDSRMNCNAIIETATNTIIAGCNTTTIPEGVERIARDAFVGAERLKKLVLPWFGHILCPEGRVAGEIEESQRQRQRKEG